MTKTSILLAVLVGCLLSANSQAGDRYLVTMNGEVEFNGIGFGPLGNVNPTDAAQISFEVDSSVFVNSGSFPTRGYEIDQSSWTYTLGALSVGLASPFPAGQTPYFVLRNDDPAVDGFLISRNINVPMEVPLDVQGQLGAFGCTWYVTYGNDPLPSLDIADAVGSYDFTGLTVFNWLIVDGPFEPFGVLFENFTIEAIETTWTDEGNALAGVLGDPILSGSGDLSGGSANAVNLGRAAPSATAGLFLALSSTPVPFKGGTLVPVPFLTPSILTTSGTGTISLPFVMPAGVPAGVELFVQFAIQDGAAVAGVSLSNAIKGTTP